MAVVGEITNNLLGLQQLKAGRQSMEAQSKRIEDDNLAAENLRKYQSSLQSGAPDYDAFNEAIIRSPEMAQNVLAGIGITERRQGLDAADFAVKAASVIDNKPQFMQLIKNRIDYLSSQGRDPKDTMDLGAAYLEGDIAGAKNSLKAVSAALANQGYLDKNIYGSLYGGVGSNAALQEFNQMTAGLSPEERERARRIKLGLDARAVGSSDVTIAQEGLTDLVGASKSAISSQVKGAESTAKGQSERKQDFINRGVSAAEGVPVVKRALTLLDTVKTGGFDKAAIQAKQMLGIESADEGELSYNLGRSVLSQLRETFGAAFTAAEGERLQQLEASLGRSPAANRRILQQAETMMLAKAKRGRKAAEESGDDFTVADIDNFLNMSISPDQKGGSGEGSNTGGIVDVNDLVNKYAD